MDMEYKINDASQYPSNFEGELKLLEVKEISLGKAIFKFPDRIQTTDINQITDNLIDDIKLLFSKYRIVKNFIESPIYYQKISYLGKSKNRLYSEKVLKPLQKNVKQYSIFCELTDILIRDHVTITAIVSDPYKATNVSTIVKNLKLD